VPSSALLPNDGKVQRRAPCCTLDLIVQLLWIEAMRLKAGLRLVSRRWNEHYCVLLALYSEGTA